VSAALVSAPQPPGGPPVAAVPVTPAPPVPLRRALLERGTSTLAVLTAISTVDYAISAVLVAAAPDVRRDLGLSDAALQGSASLTVVAVVQAIQPVHPALLSDTYDVGARARVLAVHAGGPSVGRVLGPVVLAIAALGLGGWRAAFVVLGLASLGLAVRALRLRDPGSDAPRQQVALGQAVGRLLRIRTLSVVFAGVAVLGFSLVAVPIEVSNHLERRFGLGTSERSLALAGIEVAAVLGLGVGARLYERLGARVLQAVALSTLTSGVLVCAALQLSSLTLCLVVLGLYALVASMGTAPLYTTVAAVVPPRLRALGFSLLGLVIFLGGGFLGSIFVGRLSDDHGPAFAVAAIVLPTVPIAAAVLAYGARFVAQDMLAATVAAELPAIPGATAGSRALLSVRGLDVSYGKVQVLYGIDLEVAEGEVLALLGTNGAGKSTLLRALSGLTVPDRGTVSMDGSDLTLADPAARVAHGIVQVPGGRAVFGELSVLENLLAACHTFAWDRARVRERIVEVTAIFPVLGERLEQRAGSLSGGEQQMLALAKALVLRPRVLLIDELSLGLAPVVVSQLIEVVADLKRRGVSMVIVEQSVNVAVALADRAVFLEKGQVRFSGPTAGLLERGDIARAVFLGADHA
jgi:ABC-type branched-subunit amino acid transport system ATPase component/predicted MFS family arabinose efflux permease